MINFNHLTQKELSDNGLSFETPEEADLFAEIIKEELEVRIGEAIVKCVGEERADGFELCKTQNEATAWLEQNCPEYRKIVIDKQEEMSREIMEFRDRIPGLIGAAPAGMRDIPIEEMDLSVRSFNCLKRAGLRTVGDILAYGDLGGIRNLTRRCVDEIKEKLWKFSGPRPFPDVPVYDDVEEESLEGTGFDCLLYGDEEDDEPMCDDFRDYYEDETYEGQ